LNIGDDDVTYQSLIQAATEVRTKMLGCGYGTILPLNGKAPKIDSWQKRTDATEHEINAWARMRPAETNTGLLTRDFPAIDVDILSNPDAAQAVEDLIAEELRASGKLMVRFGRKPKRAILCRSVAPFKKIRVAFDVDVVNPDTGEITTVTEAIEVLGDGQQVVCFGEHPDTRRPYEWVGGDPTGVPAADLPLITESEAREILDKAVALLTERFGFRVHAAPAKAARPDTPAAEAKTTDMATAWGAAALRSACAKIVSAESGSQDVTLNTQCYGIGQLVAGGELPEAEALSALRAASANIRDHDPKNPWNAGDLARKVERSFGQGKSKPRAAPEAEHVELTFNHKTTIAPGAQADDPWAAMTRAYVRARLANGGEHPPLTAELGRAYRENFKAAWLRVTEQAKRGALLLSSWLKLDIPPRDFLLGELLSTTSRWIVYGETGVGKTLWALDLAAAIAAGEGFLNWEGSGKRRRVMYLDGELPAETFKERLQIIAQRYGHDLELYAYNRDVLSDGEMPPLNTPPGEKWLWREIDAVKPDVIVSDSIMCLLEGSMSEEESWAPIKAMIRKISGRRIAQIWLHHTGHDTTKGFGTKTREWEMDTVVSLTDDDGSILMEFKKARLRKPETREQFEPKKIICTADGWATVGDATKRRGPKGDERAGLKRQILAAYERLADGTDTMPGLNGRPVRKVPVERLRDEVRNRGFLTVDDDGNITAAGRKAFQRAKDALLTDSTLIEKGLLIWK
jgi:hypothetical protein